MRAAPYPESLTDLAAALQRSLAAKVVLFWDEQAGDYIAPAASAKAAWLELLQRYSVAVRNSSPAEFRLAADAQLEGVRRVVVVSLVSGHPSAEPRRFMLLGFDDDGPCSHDELTALSILAEHLALAIHAASVGAPAPSRTQASLARGRSTEDFVSLAAHELRTPLTPITMLLQSLERKARTGNIDVEMILRARRQVGRLTQMINDLLDLSRMERGRLVLTPAKVDLGAAARNAVRELIESGTKHAVELIGDGAAIEILADEARLPVSLRSVLDHVARATPIEEKIEVLVSSRDSFGRVTVRASRPVFDSEPSSSAPLAEPAAKPDPMTLSVLLAQGVAALEGGSISFDSPHPGETRVEALFRLSPPGPPG